ncbi:heterokaryon incompatibility protein-domain-containing protein [Ilyonectria robusta]|uniref:heterokaryon incompatibility protein-domain-containing protein n=1 Tax=Ilyonectria robusta TaxID=1079257 RepID=UPI001E8D0E39|nr:heterokaryon incompatibility protein-domain-containing protein [Ilyonectria robusta]KAH8664807.1 heterokaryon incompatibility protein-domain-containing protein [Ilyonectria robusta]
MAHTPSFGLQNVVGNVWPQRLLRIKDMTSYELHLDGNNAYYRKKDKNPKYAIISYTWGRFRADGRGKSPINSKAEAISVNNIKWKIPAIDPEQGFTSHNFKRTLEVVAGSYDYVWVDVACINQVNDTYNQIGCQASIFNRASASFIWLHQQGSESGMTLDVLVKALVNTTQSNNIDYNDMSYAQKNASLSRWHELEYRFCSLLHDPWFSSMWTLQEAFIRKDSVILTGPGNTTRVEFNGKQVTLTLQVLLDVCHSYLSLGGSNANIARPVETAGLDLLIARNPLVLLRAARHRQAKMSQDRLAGVQRLFGVDVGKPNATPAEMEKICSLEINKRCPALAQAFIHPYEGSDGSPSWQAKLGISVDPKVHSLGRTARIDDTMIVPPDFTCAVEVAAGYRGRMFVDRNNNLSWEGSSFPLERLWSMWRQHEQHRIPPGLEEGEFVGPNGSPGGKNKPFENSFDCSIYLDSLRWLSDRPAINVLPANFMQYAWPLSTVYDLCRKRPKKVTVLVLGKIQTLIRNKIAEAWVGLLVKQHPQFNVRQRIGFCTWKGQMNNANPDRCGLA